MQNTNPNNPREITKSNSDFCGSKKMSKIKKIDKKAILFALDFQLEYKFPSVIKKAKVIYERNDRFIVAMPLLNSQLFFIK